MAARNWRTIDIDALDPEGQLMEDELVDPDPRSPADALNQARSKNQDVRSALQRCADVFCVLVHADLLLFRSTDQTLREPWRRHCQIHLMGQRMQKRVCVFHSRIHVYCSLIESAPKTITLQTVLSVLNTVRATDIAKTVASLDPVTQDNLMKYIYKGMASVEEGGNCATLLNWHEKVGN